jgi:predicted metal-dependent hydrolase
MDARLREGIRLFNAGRFFEAHEVWEGFYHETDNGNKPFIEGLIQLAAAFRISSDFGDIKGPVRMIRQSVIRFENYQPTFLQVRVKELSAAVVAWANQAEASKTPVESSTIPKIRLRHFSFFS